jgi:hypothetical protein
MDRLVQRGAETGSRSRDRKPHYFSSLCYPTFRRETTSPLPSESTGFDIILLYHTATRAKFLQKRHWYIEHCEHSSCSIVILVLNNILVQFRAVWHYGNPLLLFDISTLLENNMRYGRYFIQPLCGVENGLVIGIMDPVDNASVRLVPMDKYNAHAIWDIVPDNGGMEGTTFYIRPALGIMSGQVTIGGWLTAPYADSPVEIASTFEVMREHDQQQQVHNRDTWQLVPQGDGTWGALQLVRNTRQNLNVAGNGPYPAGTQIFSYNWNNGAANELWRLVPVDS